MCFQKHRFSLVIAGIAISLPLMAFALSDPSPKQQPIKLPPPKKTVTPRNFVPHVRRRPQPKQPQPPVQIVSTSFQPGIGIDVLVQADRATVRALRIAREHVKKKEYVKAIVILQKILNRNKDGFFFDDPVKRDVLQSVRSSAAKLIADMPTEGRKLYELKSGGTARNLVNDAINAGDIDKLTDASRRYFHTKAGYAAMYQLGVHYLDRNEPLAAALCFRRLLDVPDAARQWEPMLSLRAAIAWNRAGLTKKSQQTLAGFRKQNGGAALRIGGRKVQPFAKDSDALPWLAKHFGTTGTAVLGESQWTAFRGNEARNGIAILPNKADTRTWRKTIVSEPEYPSFDQTEKVAGEQLAKMRSVIKGLVAMNAGQSPPMLPTTFPLIVGDRIVTRTTSALRTIDLQDGSRIDDSLFDRAIWEQTRLIGARPLPTFLQRQLWGNLSWGTLSSDGRLIYSVEFTRQPKDYNHLFAIDATTGKIVWDAGGPTSLEHEEDHFNPLAGAYFLGAPLPIGNTLYCLAEVNSEIQLRAIEYSPQPKGISQNEGVKLLWTQPLVAARVKINRDLGRRMSAASVSYADGVLVCCTDAGYVVGVELSSRSLLWAYKYERFNGGPGPFPRPRPPIPPPAAGPQWVDYAATIADGHVLLTPRGTNQLVCLKLVDGSLAWKKPRGDGRYVAGVIDGKVIVAGSKSVRALSLSDGKSAWKKPATIPELSGRGIIAGNRFFVPAGKAGIIQLDTKTGDKLLTTKLPKNHRPGNLLISGGTMISQTADAIEAFPVPLKADAKTASR